MNRNTKTQFENSLKKEVPFKVHTITNFRVEMQPASESEDVRVTIKFENSDMFYWTEYVFTVDRDEASTVYDLAEVLMNHGYVREEIGEALACAYNTEVLMEDVCYRIKDYKNREIKSFR